MKRKQSTQNTRLLAVAELGSNASRLALFTAGGKSQKMPHIHEERLLRQPWKRPGLTNLDRLTPARTQEITQHWQLLTAECQKHNAVPIGAVATGVFRKLQGSVSLFQKLHRGSSTWPGIELLSPRREAQLLEYAYHWHHARARPPLCLIDLGAHSMQVVAWVNAYSTLYRSYELGFTQLVERSASHLRERTKLRKFILQLNLRTSSQWKVVLTGGSAYRLWKSPSAPLKAFCRPPTRHETSTKGATPDYKSAEELFCYLLHSFHPNPRCHYEAISLREGIVAEWVSNRLW